MSIKKNFAYNSILTVSNYIFPLLTYPYVSRVLGVSNIGICNFVDSIINYFILFSMLGIGATGIREVAKYKNDRAKLDQTFSNLFLLNGISTLIMLVLLALSILFVPKLSEHTDMLILGFCKLLFNLFLTEWFFRGVENFKYITQRSVIVKLLYVLSVFVFVRDATDYKIYYGLLVGTIVVNSLLNSFYRKKFVRLNFSNISFKQYLKSFFTIGIYLMLSSMYTSFNIAYLGFVSGETEVGYYTTATKLYAILLSFFTAFTSVMLPRMSSLVAEGKIDELKRLTAKSYDALIIFCIPVIIISTIFAPEVVNIIAGEGYEGAILPMRIVMPLLLIIGVEQILILQILMPLKKDNKILINSFVGAAIGMTLNLLLVSRYQSVGSAIVWVCSEIGVLIVAQYFVKKELGVAFPIKSLVVNLLYAIPIVSVSLIIHFYIEMNGFMTLMIVGSVSALYLGIVQIFFIKNELALNVLSPVLQKINLKNR